MAVTFLSRAQWGAGGLGSGRRLPHAQFVGLVAHHTASVMPDYDRDGRRYGDLQDIQRYMRWLQHARPDLGNDVPYSFVVFEGARPEDCVVAEGRGFGVSGAHTSGFNSTRYGVSLAGNSSTRPVTEGILSGFRWVGRRLADPAGAEPTIGHRDTKATECPGSSLYAALPQIQPPFEEEDMPLTSDDLERIEAKVRQVLNEGTAKGQRSWSDTSKATLAQVQHNTVLLNAIRTNLRVANVDEAELAAAIAPLLAANTEALSDDELDTVVKAVRDEQQRRAAG
jgi:hypothetical protein